VDAPLLDVPRNDLPLLEVSLIRAPASVVGFCWRCELRFTKMLEVWMGRDRPFKGNRGQAQSQVARLLKSPAALASSTFPVTLEPLGVNDRVRGQ